MEKREKVLKVIDALIVQHERMFEGHKARKADSIRDAILRADEQMLNKLREDYVKAQKSDDIEGLYKAYEDQIILRKI